MTMTVWLTSCALTLGGYGLLVLLGRRIDRDPALTKIVLWSYGVRVVLTLSLFFISFWQLPILRALQMEGGFWTFGLDGVAHHRYGAEMAEAWKWGIEIPNPGGGIEYFVVVALIYKLLGSSHPLYPALVNCLMAAANGLLAYLIVNRLADRRAALRSAALVSFWPSTLIWSTQLLKDSLSWTLIFFVLWLVVRTVPRASDGNRSAVRWVGLYLLLATAVILVTRLRFYVGSALSLAALLVFVPAAVIALKKKRIARWAWSLGIALVMVTSTLFARTLDTWELLTPARPEVGHFRLGIEYWKRADFQRSEEEFRRSLRLLSKKPAALEPPEQQVPISTQSSQVFATQGKQELGHVALAAAPTAHQVAARVEPAAAAVVTSLSSPPPPEGVPPSARSQAELPRPLGHVVSSGGEVHAAPIAPPPPLGPEPASTGSTLRSPTASSDPLSILARALTQTQQEDKERGSRGRVGKRRKGLGFSMDQLDDYVLMAAYEIAPQELILRRQGFIFSRGHSLMDSGVEITGLQQLITYLPRALLIGVLAPFPWQWFDTKGSTGVMRTFAGIEMVCVYFLLPGILVGIWNVVRQRQPAGLFLLSFVMLLAVVLSLVVANLGTLFRLRLQFLLPLLIVAAAGDPVAIYKRFFDRLPLSPLIKNRVRGHKSRLWRPA